MTSEIRKEIQGRWTALDSNKRKLAVFVPCFLLVFTIATHPAILHPSRQVARPMGMMQQERAQQERVRQERAATASRPPSVTGDAGASSALQSSGDFLGNWQGRSSIARQGICSLSLEIRAEADGRFTGYPVLACMPLAPFLVTGQEPKTPEAAAALSLKSFIDSNPMTAVLSGTQGPDGTVKFRVTQITGTNNSGCTWTQVNAVPFGEKKLSVNWLDNCGGGSVLLMKQPKGVL